MSPDHLSDEQPITLLTALRTAYCQNGNPASFISRANAQISQIEHDIIETCSKYRIRIDDNLYTLLESRDSISEQKADIDTATASASEITLAVDQAIANLSDKMRVRQNLDAALAVAAQTRKLTRMYARIEDTIDSRRLYTAFRMLKVLEEETRCVKPGSILQELVPDSHRLRSTIVLHARKAFHSWLASVRKSESALGAYALFHENKQALGRQQLVNVSTLGPLGEIGPVAYGSKASVKSRAEPSGKGLGGGNGLGRSRPWTPLLSSGIATGGAGLMHTSKAFASQRVGVVSPVTGGLSPDSNFRPEVRADARGNPVRSFLTDHKDEAPMLYLRPLLQSVLVNDGLDLLGDMRADYRRERHAHLKKILFDMDSGADGDGFSEREVVHQLGSLRAREIETFLFRVCGFFVVERAVEMHAQPALLPRAVVDFEWWSLAFQRVQGVLKEQEDAAMHSPKDKAWARSLQSSLKRFAQANEFVS